MQADKFKVTKDYFGHGSIFKFSGLKFKNLDKTEFKFSDFYPHADMQSIRYGVVCTQDCDIEQKKVSHINIAFLEPIQRPKKENPIKFLDLDFAKLVVPFEDMNFYSSGMLRQLQLKVEELLDNTSAHYMFVDLAGSYHFVNLAKMYPIKFEHFEDIKAQAEFQLSGSFKHLLGWKIANLYGRVGVEAYSKTVKAELTVKIIGSVGDSVKSYWPKNSYELSDEQLKELRSDLGSYSAQKDKGKDVEKLAKKIYEKLAIFGVVKPIGLE